MKYVRTLFQICCNGVWFYAEMISVYNISNCLYKYLVRYYINLMYYRGINNKAQ